MSRPIYEILSEILTTHPSQVYGENLAGRTKSFSKSINSSRGFNPLESKLPQCPTIPSLTAYVKLKFLFFPSLSFNNSNLSTNCKPFLPMPKFF